MPVFLPKWLNYFFTSFRTPLGRLVCAVLALVHLHSIFQLDLIVSHNVSPLPFFHRSSLTSWITNIAWNRPIPLSKRSWMFCNSQSKFYLGIFSHKSAYIFLSWILAINNIWADNITLNSFLPFNVKYAKEILQQLHIFPSTLHQLYTFTMMMINHHHETCATFIQQSISTFHNSKNSKYSIFRPVKT